MKRLLLPLLAGIAALAQVPSVRSVYILPMAGGLDQYLAAELTREHSMQVVADPKAADAVLTDRLGESFEQKMTQIHPRDKDDVAENSAHPSFRSSGSRGTIFLVDSKSRQVLWSDYEKPTRSASSGSLNREAARIAKKLAARSK